MEREWNGFSEYDEIAEEVTGMKAYRKKLIGLALAAVFSFSPVSVFASSVNITSGLQIGGDEVECTFDSSRILYGEAKPGTDITFTVSKMDRFRQYGRNPQRNRNCRLYGAVQRNPALEQRE